MPLLVIALLLLSVPDARAQTPGPAAFRVYEHGTEVGTLEMVLERLPDGWRLRGSSRIAGSVPVAIPYLDLHYDRAWNARFMSMEMEAPTEMHVHVASLGDTTRTDIMLPGRVRHRANSISPNTIFLPDRAFGAYEAVAARLVNALPGATLPLFVAPEAETRALVEGVSGERIRTTRGVVPTRRYRLTEIRDGLTPVEIWVDNGRLLRLEVPRWGISVVRSDVL